MAEAISLEKNETQKNFLEQHAQSQEEQKTLAFFKEYQELCQRYNRTLIPQIKLDIAYVNPPSNLVGAVSGDNKHRR